MNGWLVASGGFHASNHAAPCTLMVCEEHRLTFRYVATIDNAHVFACPRWVDHEVSE